jgi:hypothetical protein
MNAALAMLQSTSSSLPRFLGGSEEDEGRARCRHDLAAMPAALRQFHGSNWTNAASL